MKLPRAALTVLGMALIWGCASPRPVGGGGSGAERAGGAARVSSAAAQRTMTVADYIATELSGPPIIAGFDVDDTTMFTSPGFWWGKIELGDRATRLPSTLSDPQERAAAERFWRRMNTELDRYSTVKDSARALIAAHRARGDAIIFITGRPDIRDGRDGLAEKIASEMGLERPEIHYVGQLDKVAVLRQARVAVYYGDARADMESAAAAGARPVAVIRSRLSGNNNAQAREGPYQVLLTDSEN